MTARQDLIDRTARRLLAFGYRVYGTAPIGHALRAEGWTATTEAAYRRILGDVQRAAREIYTDSLPKTWS